MTTTGFLSLLTHVLLLQTLYNLVSCSLLDSALAKSSSTTYNVVEFGAKPDGKTDSSKAFLDAWNKACSSPTHSSIYVPRGRFLIGSSVTFSGQNCANKGMVSITISGTLVAPSYIGDHYATNCWLSFYQVSGLSIHGGVLDGQGKSLWDCKKSGKKTNCPNGTSTSLAISNSNNIVIAGLTSLNSKMFHIAINGCHNVKVLGAIITAPGNSPNTDGIHVQLSSDVTILKPKINTGDDCISIGPGTRNLWIEGATCGPGHGISIGSLGWNLKEPGVKNVTVKSSTFYNTQNGFRIKSWGRPTSGFVRHVHFVHAIMNNVQNPILIDQNYCPSHKGCPNKASGIMVGDVTYKDIHGTSATKVAVRFDCSSMHPCKKIKLEDVKLTYKNQAAQALCNHAGGTALGTVQPESCL